VSAERSTSLHLHYQVIVDCKRKNFQNLKHPSDKTLTVEDREKFKILEIKIHAIRPNLIN
jgi:hypothetical protein